MMVTGCVDIESSSAVSVTSKVAVAVLAAICAKVIPIKSFLKSRNEIRDGQFLRIGPGRIFYNRQFPLKCEHAGVILKLGGLADFDRHVVREFVVGLILCDGSVTRSR